jgi:hypothetical protein
MLQLWVEAADEIGVEDVDNMKALFCEARQKLVEAIASGDGS